MRKAAFPNSMRRVKILSSSPAKVTGNAPSRGGFPKEDTAAFTCAHKT